MLFLVKRHWVSSLIALAVLLALGLGLRHLLGGGVGCTFSATALLLGVAAFLAVLTSDVALHGLFGVLFGDRYRRRHRELAEVFRGQGLAAIVAGAAVAGLGEELVFRGLSLNPAYLIGAAVVFGLLHHIRWSLWPFTVWAVWQGLLLAAALYLTGDLAVTMVAHFLHDFAGFLIFRHLNRHGGKPPEPVPGVEAPGAV
jgi:membrane protease YdiL (CAAX protease family)